VEPTNSQTDPWTRDRGDSILPPGHDPAGSSGQEFEPLGRLRMSKQWLLGGAALALALASYTAYVQPSSAG